MRIFISGGCKNGKSMIAQKLAKKQARGTLYYLATMQPVDEEDTQRISRHQKERDGWGFVTVEVPSNLADTVLQLDSNGSYLLDSVTAWLANDMFCGGTIDSQAHVKIGEDIQRICAGPKDLIIVSDYIFSEEMRYDLYTRAYCKNLAYLDKIAARYCDVVVEVCFGTVVFHKKPNDLHLFEEWLGERV